MASTQSAGEDFFLELAAESSDYLAEDLARKERRRSRIIEAIQRTSRSPDNSHFEADEISSHLGSNLSFVEEPIEQRYGRRRSILALTQDQQHMRHYQHVRDYSPRQSIYTPRRSASNSVVDIGERYTDPVQFGRRRPSLSERMAPHRSRQTHLDNLDTHSFRTQPHDNVIAPASVVGVHSSNFPIPAPSDMPESLSSTPASATTVWDDLVELKARAKRLELGSTTDRTSLIGMTAESDRRGTHKHNGIHVPASKLSNIHPNLHEALSKAKCVTNPTVYEALEAVALEALNLATITGSAGPQGTAYTAASIINGATVSDRQVRRRADNVCRNLTDLCIALCENETSLYSQKRSSSRPTSRDQTSVEPSPLASLDQRRSRVGSANAYSSSHLPPARMQLRTESRLSEYDSTQSGHPAIRHPSRRMSTLSAQYNSNELCVKEGDEPPVRAPSRAMTEAGDLQLNRLPSGNYSHNLLARHPVLQSSSAIRQRAFSGTRSTAFPSLTTPSSDSGVHDSPEFAGFVNHFTGRAQSVAAAGQLGNVSSAGWPSRGSRGTLGSSGGRSKTVDPTIVE